ncbi:tyrosine-type recombinase/integrase [Domibacillus robiginosus]|uniref:tyrosine-type recombinase/integrase n=1 Tax=Domibacillus robiginosus TaxID=1071054 RepID=UPI00067B61C0|nr:tyrosine-type recombinase/integrase [Domibacillus robiginosus]
MNLPAILASHKAFLQLLQSKEHLLDEERNLSLAHCTDEEFLEYFFAIGILKENRTFSPHTIKAYRSDAKTLLAYLSHHNLAFRAIGFPEVKAFNRFIVSTYKPKSALRKLEFFRRFLEFGFHTHFYTAQLSVWIQKPHVQKGHTAETDENRTVMRELSSREARHIIDCFAETIKTTKNAEAIEARNRLIGMMLLTLGIRASELIGLNWGSFRRSRQGDLVVDVIGKGGKERTLPVMRETESLLFHYRSVCGDTIELQPNSAEPLFYALYNKTDIQANKKRLSYAALYKLVKRAVEAAGSRPDVSPHWFRHTFVTNLLEQDVPLAVVKDLAGHADISITNLYLERIQEDRMHDHLKNVRF